MKQAQSQKPHWWINNLTPAAVKFDVCKQGQIRGCIIDLQNISDAIAYTSEFDDLLNENLEAPTGAVFQKAIMKSAETFTAQPGGWVSLPFLPVVLNDQKDVDNGLAVLGADLHQDHTLLQLSAVPENIAFAADLVQKGYSLNFSDVLIEDQMQRIVAAFVEGIKARQGEGLDVSNLQIFLSVPVNTDEISNIAQVGREQCTEAEIDYMQKLYTKFSEIVASDEMSSLVEAGVRKPEMIWTDILPADGANADTYYIEMLDGDANFEADLHLVCRSSKTGVNTIDTIDEPCTEGEIPAFSPEQIISFYERRNKAAEAAWRKAIRLVREKIGDLEMNKKSFEFFNADKVGIAETVQDIVDKDLVARIWEHDYTVWRPDPKEISNRLGWLHCPQRMLQNVKYLESFVAEIVLNNQFTHVVLCGMGGSSLAPEVFQKTFGTKQGYLEILVLDSTDPWAMHHVDDTVNLEKTLFLVSTKSGGTVETLSMMKYYYHRMVARVGAEEAGKHFVAITDPGSKLIGIAEQYDFRRIFLNDPNIGGRYSALSYFGLLPAALSGIDVRSLLEIAQGMAVHLSKMPATVENMGLQLGALLGKGAISGKDKLTFILSPAIENFGSWVEQLIAESTGKEGKGILPVVGEKVLSPQYYGDDRLFVYMHVGEDRSNESAVQTLVKAGFPVIDIHMDTILELGAQFLLWEFATALASAVMDIQPFDQPSVESAKVLARKMVAEYKESGSLTTEKPIFQQQEISVFGCCEGSTLSEILTTFLNQLDDGKYCAIQAYLPPSEDVHTALADMQTRIHANMKCAATIGIGPRYLHSTGQLHKGDGGNGVFLQITSDPVIDLQIPDEMEGAETSISFGILKMAQALGDQEALRAAGRAVLHVHLGKDVYSGLKQISLSLAKLQ